MAYSHEEPALAVAARGATATHAAAARRQDRRLDGPVGAVLALQRAAGNAAVAGALSSGRLVHVQRTTAFEPLMPYVYEIRGAWHGFPTRRGGWHVSIFPTGSKGKRVFDEFHVTYEKMTGNKHHFYKDDGHVKLNDLNNVSLGNREMWGIANELAADFFQQRLGLHVTKEMLDDETKTLRQGQRKIKTMKEHLAEAEAQVKARALTTVPIPAPSADIDMFAFSDDEEQLTEKPLHAAPQHTMPQHSASQQADPRTRLHSEYAARARALGQDDEEVLQRLESAVDALHVMFLRFDVQNEADMRELYESTLRGLQHVDVMMS